MSKHNLDHSQPPEPDYTERAHAMTEVQRAAIVEVMSEKYGAMRQVSETKKFAALKMLDLSRELGAQIELFTGHEKLLSHEFNRMAVAVPDARLEFFRQCLANHQKYPQPVTNYAIAEAECEKLMVTMELLPAAHRVQSLNPQPVEPVKDYLSDVIKVSQAGVKLFAQYPPEGIQPFLRQSLLKEMRPLMEWYGKLELAEAGK